MEVIDEAAFADLVGRHERELHVHCYRMLGSFDEAEDLLQDVLLRAWHGWSSFEGRSSARVWLYRIATNACLDRLRHRARQPEVDELSDVPWLQPYPDDPGETAVGRETMELVFLAALQLLPPRQRAVLILRDVLGWPARETASLLTTTATAVHSSLQRARATLREHLPDRSEWVRPAALDGKDRLMLDRYLAAHERGDTEAVLALLHEDLVVWMPPDPRVWRSRADYAAYAFGGEPPGRWRLRFTGANGQPAMAFYLRRPGDTAFRATALQVLRVEGGLITEITAFQQPRLFAAFGLPPETPA
ncbi:RNA polymerase subunit sigma-70 [Nonomuraea sp. NPDC050556]|uniref:RNA polymerase subunit sigma-70 n=1 Tax=Nonomuraea sp. NPDC050556 TaxID=3364369 RepID=UPI0037A18FE6